MRKTILTVLFISYFGGQAWPAQDSSQKEEKKNEKSFCAGIGTDTPIFDLNKGHQLVITFMVFNDGRIAGDPRYSESELLINGQAMEGFINKIGNGIGPASFQRVLEPGHSLHVNRTFTKSFTKTGIYKLVWKNAQFESPELTIRVVGSK